jgi:hypothetical protein
LVDWSNGRATHGSLRATRLSYYRWLLFRLKQTGRRE